MDKIQEGKRSKKLSRATKPENIQKYKKSQASGMARRGLKPGKGGEAAFNHMFGIGRQPRADENISEAVLDSLINLIIEKNVNYYLNEGGDLDIDQAEEEEDSAEQEKKLQSSEAAEASSRQAAARAQRIRLLQQKKAQERAKQQKQ